MAKLYFKYGSMGSSKTAQALITKYNYEENGMRVWLVKPAADSRDGEIVLRSASGWKRLPRSYRRRRISASCSAKESTRTSSSSTNASS